MATNDSGESARFAGMNPPLQGVLMPNGERVVGYSVLDEIALAAQARHMDGDDYTYDRHDYMPNKRGGVTVVEAQPLTPYPERNDARVGELEEIVAALENTNVWLVATVDDQARRLAHVEALLHTALNPEPTP